MTPEDRIHKLEKHSAFLAAQVAGVIPVRLADGGVGEGGGSGTQTAKVATGISAATASTFGSGWVLLQDKETLALATEAIEVKNPLINVPFGVNYQVVLDMTFTPPRVITGSCGAVPWT